jgi:hypothetical protein
MFKCNNCGKYTARYIYSEKQYECTQCGNVEKVIPKIKKCVCGHEFIYFTWFDPSGCGYCSRSFVD